MSWISKIIAPILSLIAPSLRAELENFFQSLYDRAKSTSSPLDDLGVKLLASLLGIDVK